LVTYGRETAIKNHFSTSGCFLARKNSRNRMDWQATGRYNHTHAGLASGSIQLHTIHLRKRGGHMFDARKTGEKIAGMRREREMTQERLAEKLGVSAQAVSKWENGYAMPEIAVLAVLSEILECPADAILFPDEYLSRHKNYVHTLLPYQATAVYSGSGWPRSMAFPAVMAALKMFMGLEERRNFDDCQVNDDQEYILQSGISTLAFGFSHYNREFIHDCFLIYGLDYETIGFGGKTLREIRPVIRRQLQLGFPVIVQDMSNNAAFLFITGITSDGLKIRAHDFLEGMDENNRNINFYDMKTMDNWFKPEMECLLILRASETMSVGKACENALRNFCLMMSGKWDREEFCSAQTDAAFARFMNYGLKGYAAYIDYLQRSDATIGGFYPQQAIFHESCQRTLEFLNMCKVYIKDIDMQSLNTAIGRYDVLLKNAWEIIDISWNDPARTEPEPEKMREIAGIMIRSNEIFMDAINNVKKAIGFTLGRL